MGLSSLYLCSELHGASFLVEMRRDLFVFSQCLYKMLLSEAKLLVIVILTVYVVDLVFVTVIHSEGIIFTNSEMCIFSFVTFCEYII